MTRSSLSALSLVVSLSCACAAFWGCDDSSNTGSTDGTGGKMATGGSPNSGGTGGGNDEGLGGGGSSGDSGIPIEPQDGWVDDSTNPLGIVGALFSASDEESGVGLMEDFSGPACISGTAAQVDLNCTFEPPATDCYGQFWGAEVALNLHQPKDPDTGLGGTPTALDLSSLSGFAFTITGDDVPASLRFKVEDENGEYCNPGTKAIASGRNEVSFTDLLSECWNSKGTGPDPSKLVRIGWQVVTNAKSTVSFDFCVSDIEAIPK